MQSPEANLVPFGQPIIGHRSETYVHGLIQPTPIFTMHTNTSHLEDEDSPPMAGRTIFASYPY